MCVYINHKCAWCPLWRWYGITWNQSYRLLLASQHVGVGNWTLGPLQEQVLLTVDLVSPAPCFTVFCKSPSPSLLTEISGYILLEASSVSSDSSQAFRINIVTPYVSSGSCLLYRIINYFPLSVSLHPWISEATTVSVILSTMLCTRWMYVSCLMNDGFSSAFEPSFILLCLLTRVVRQSPSPAMTSWLTCGPGQHRVALCCPHMFWISSCCSQLRPHPLFSSVTMGTKGSRSDGMGLPCFFMCLDLICFIVSKQIEHCAVCFYNPPSSSQTEGSSLWEPFSKHSLWSTYILQSYWELPRVLGP